MGTYGRFETARELEAYLRSRGCSIQLAKRTTALVREHAQEETMLAPLQDLIETIRAATR
ncbi:MAG: hypothetical protein HZB55_02705 [Deltaproteobacteria bacterium]|nr:hypothetical protein [Deltaproteobacteria bacterium]